MPKEESQSLLRAARDNDGDLTDAADDQDER